MNRGFAIKRRAVGNKAVAGGKNAKIPKATVATVITTAAVIALATVELMTGLKVVGLKTK